MDEWKKKGFHFKCTGCGKCCTGSPGYVWISADEISALSRHLQLSEEAFMRQYTRKIGHRISLKETLPHYDCIFLESGKFCKVYHLRPLQCRTFPWWKEHLESEKNWQEVAERCEGINHPDAEFISLEQVESIIKTH